MSYVILHPQRQTTGVLAWGGYLPDGAVFNGQPAKYAGYRTADYPAGPKFIPLPMPEQSVPDGCGRLTGRAGHFLSLERRGRLELRRKTQMTSEFMNRKTSHRSS